ncbi:MAG: molybdopterin molybdotransferase MoeA [Thermodesulfobacteriota bacterium]|nr:molybdopterin molybdotransferase MoeA [Thermodesulfobacteriota bacterium]
MMEEFFKVMTPAAVLAMKERFSRVETEAVSLSEALDRLAGADIVSPVDLPGFNRSVMDGYAVAAASTFGASDGSPAFLTIKGSIPMGAVPEFDIRRSEAAAIATGGMLPAGADAVVMKEHANAVSETELEVYKPVAPGGNMVGANEDFEAGGIAIARGTLLRSQEIGLLAGMGLTSVTVYRKPLVGIISTGDEIVTVEESPPPGHIRDMNTYTLAALVRESGGAPVNMGVVPDRYEVLYEALAEAVKDCDAVLVSGGSSVGARDYTKKAITALPDAELLVHGVAMRPGKPTMLARSWHRMVWGIPGQVTSAMVVYMIMVRPFVQHIGGYAGTEPPTVSARIARNVPSVYGRTDFVRVWLEADPSGGRPLAHPVFGKSGLINTMVKADGLVAIDADSEGINKGDAVAVIRF